MTTPLFVFGDEYGTMPVKDNDGPFLAAVVAMRSPPPVETETSGHRERVADKLREVGALVHVAYAIPSDGYGEMLQAKIASINALARTNFQKDGRNSSFWNEYGVPIRNHVWQTCMGASLAAVMGSAAFTGPIEQVHVHLDQKTLSKESLATFSVAVGRIPERLKEKLLQFPGSVDARRALEGLRAYPPRLTVTWKEKEERQEFAFGLKLAHLVADIAGKAFEASRKNDPLEFLTTRRVEAKSTDMTPVLLQDLTNRPRP
jgi:hypothetical protein